MHHQMVDIHKVNESYEVLNHTPVGICIINQDYEIIFWNKILENWTTIDKDTILKKKLTEVFPNLNAPKYLSRIGTVLNGGAPSIFSSQLHKNLFPAELPDGSSRIQHTTVASVPSLENDNGSYACIVIEDVSELTKRIQDYRAMRDKAIDENQQRKKAEKALRESENRLRAFMDSATECFLLCDSELNIVEMNKTAKHVFMTNTANGNESEVKSLKTLSYEFQKKEWQSLFEAVVNTGKADEKILEMNHASRGELLFDVHVFQVNDGLGLIAEDITQRSKYEAKLQYTLSELKRSNKELEQFGYIISHDLQEPLRMVSSYLQLISRKYVSKLDEDADEFIQYAVDGATRMQKMIKDLLRFSQFSSQQQTFKKIDLNQVIKDVLKDLSIAIKESDAVIETEQLPVIMADKTLITQLMLNLLNNAIKFRSKKKLHIHIASEKRENEWIISVKDNGIGIPQKDTERIFGFFQKLHTFKDYKGSGLGLTICKKIIERHNGRIWVESAVDAGSTFFVGLPADKEFT